MIQKIPITVSGCLHSVSVYLKNTGSSGTTSISIYLNDILKKSYTIPADGTEYNDVHYFDLTDLVHPKDLIKVDFVSTATSYEALKVNAYYMTFPFKMKTLFLGNLYGSLFFAGEDNTYFFKSADYWVIEMNQPIEAVEYLKGIDINNVENNLTYTIENGLFYNSRLKITPYTTLDLEEIKFKVEDIKGQRHIISLTPTVKDNFASYPYYVIDASKEITLFVAAKAYRYSFNGGTTWSDWAAISSDKITIDFSEESEGAKTLTVAYRNGSEEVQEDVAVYYLTSAINCSLVFFGTYAKLNYTDSVPLDKVQLFYDGILANETLLTQVTGFSTCSGDNGTEKVTAGSGSLYYDGEKFDYAGGTHDVLKDISVRNGWSVYFGFNYNTKTFEFREEASDSLGLMEHTFYDFEVIWKIGYRIDYVLDGGGTTDVVFTTAVYKFIEGKIEYELDVDKTILIRVIDVAGRTKDYSHDYVLDYYNTWRTLVVTDDESSVIENGEIHQEIDLIYTVTSEEN